MVAHYILNFTKKAAPAPATMPALARELLSLGFYGIPETAQSKYKVRTGDGVLLLVGAPHNIFVGSAVVACGYHRWSEDERARLPAWLPFTYGIALQQVRVWTPGVSIMSVWAKTSKGRAGKKALFFGTLTMISSPDAAIISADATFSVREPDRVDPGLITPPTAADEKSAYTVSQGVAAVDVSAPGAALAPTGQVHLEMRKAVDLAARALHQAAESPDWMPERVAHADWGTAPNKRVVVTAELRDGAYIAHAPTTVGATGGLLEKMRLPAEPRVTTLLGFDFAIGLPRAYARRAGINEFVPWFRALELDAEVFHVASELAEVSTDRPFFPYVIQQPSPGIKGAFHQQLGLSGADVLRRCDRAHCGRPVASEMFWTLGRKAVGKATLSGWKDTLHPALAEQGRTYAIWPFDGALPTLLSSTDAVIVETYPADAYIQLDLRIAATSASKTRQDDRCDDATRILEVCAECAVLPDDDLTEQILNGFGPEPAGEDGFDAVTGLLAMIYTIRHNAEPQLPDDPAITAVEGWMFGQHSACPSATG